MCRAQAALSMASARFAEIVGRRDVQNDSICNTPVGVKFLKANDSDILE
jgi:hypothetical protein